MQCNLLPEWTHGFYWIWKQRCSCSRNTRFIFSLFLTLSIAYSSAFRVKVFFRGVFVFCGENKAKRIVDSVCEFFFHFCWWFLIAAVNSYRSHEICGVVATAHHTHWEFFNSRRSQSTIYTVQIKHVVNHNKTERHHQHQKQWWWWWKAVITKQQN